MDALFWHWLLELFEVGAGALLTVGVVLWGRAFARRLAAHEDQSTRDRADLHRGQDALHAQLTALHDETARQTAILTGLVAQVQQINSDTRAREIAEQVVTAFQTGRGQQVNIGEMRAARDAHLSSTQGGGPPAGEPR